MNADGKRNGARKKEKGRGREGEGEIREKEGARKSERAGAGEELEVSVYSTDHSTHAAG